jgi:phosphatidylglycerophosphate synthase
VSAQSAIVNVLTFLRVPLVLAWLAFAVAQEYLGGFWLGFWALAAMFLSGITDLFDGMLARRWKVVSTLGKMADPLMDKIFYVVTFPSLIWQIARQGQSDVHAMVMLAFTILYLSRDMWVTFIRSVGAMYGADVAAMYLGKVRTALSFPCAGWTYMYLAFHAMVPQSWDFPWLMSCFVFEGFMILITIITLFTYTKAYLPYLKKALAQK